MDASVWEARHRAVCLLVWLHAIGLAAAAVLGERALVAHNLAEASVVSWLALLGELQPLSRRIRSGAATLGLLTSSALIVHLSGGQIEAHFHFFVVVAVVALYQDWQPFLLALAFVVVHHSVVGAAMPAAVYNHDSGANHPWYWGLVHGGFILAESVACLVYWRANEQSLDRERAARREAEDAHRDLAEAQALSRLGSWEWDRRSGHVRWSDHLYVLLGVDRDRFIPSISAFLGLVHPDDRAGVATLLDTAVQRFDLDFECRVRRSDGTVRTVHVLGAVTTRADGHEILRGTCHDVTEHTRLRDAMTQLAFEDPLTGLANRRAFTERVSASHQDGPHILDAPTGRGIVVIDLDGFKDINDTHGHAAGDTVLREVGDRLRDVVRRTDTVARLGGDEFAVLCHVSDPSEIDQAAKRLKQALTFTARIEDRAVAVRASIGWALASPGKPVEQLLREADRAMYDDKRETRGAPLVR